MTETRGLHMKMVRPALVALIVLCSSGARADDWETCRLSPKDEGVAACTRLIDSKSLSARQRAEAFRERGLYFMGDDTDLAISDFAQAIRLAPRWPDGYVSRGNALSRKGQTEAAMADFAKAIEIDPGFHNAYLARGSLRAKSSDFTGAILDFNKAISIDASSYAAYRGRGLAYKDSKSVDRAIADFERCAEMSCNNAQLRASIDDLLSLDRVENTAKLLAKIYDNDLMLGFKALRQYEKIWSHAQTIGQLSIKSARERAVEYAAAEERKTPRDLHKRYRHLRALSEAERYEEGERLGTLTRRSGDHGDNDRRGQACGSGWLRRCDGATSANRRVRGSPASGRAAWRPARSVRR